MADQAGEPMDVEQVELKDVKQEPGTSWTPSLELVPVIKVEAEDPAALAAASSGPAPPPEAAAAPEPAPVVVDTFMRRGDDAELLAVVRTAPRIDRVLMRLTVDERIAAALLARKAKVGTATSNVRYISTGPSNQCRNDNLDVPTRERQLDGPA